MAAAFVTFPELQALSGMNRKADVIRWAESQGIRFKYGKNGIWTTPDALNAALGLQSAGNDQYSADILP
jgi:hypothetical protein